MKGKISQTFFLGAIIILIGIICVYGMVINNNTNIEDEKTEKYKYYEFNNEERNYLKEREYINIYIDENLQYLMNDDTEGFLWEYLNSIFDPANVKVKLTKKADSADCWLMIINDRIRNESNDISYTTPLFQMNGALFINKEAAKKQVLSGVVMDYRLKPGELNELKYNGTDMKFLEVDTAAEAVSAAIKGNKDFILGDRSAIINELGGNKEYLAVEESVYSNNVCIITLRDEMALSGILNQCLYAADRHKLTYELGQKWFDGNGPRYMDDSYEDIYMLVLIIFTAILIAFFIYYQANKNLYYELNDRMEKLTESKQELKTTFNGVGHYLAEINLEGSILDINRAFYYFVETDTINRKIWDVLELEDNYKNKIQQMVAMAGEGRKTKSIEIRLKKQTLVVDVFHIEGVRGAVEKLLFMAMDVTNERMAERQLLQDNKMIAVGQLAAGVAHEIRNPLGIIRNYCYVLKNMEDENIKGKAIEQIEKAVDKSGAIINNLLNFSRVSAKRGETINIEEHIWSLVQLNNNIFKKKI